MDCGRIVAARFDRGHRGGVAVRHRSRLAACAQGILGKDLARRDHLFAAGAAAGGHRLSAAHFVRPARTDRGVSRRLFRPGLFVSLDRRGARLRRYGLSAHGAADQAGARGHRPAARRRGRNARRQSFLGVFDSDAAAGAAGHHRRRGHVFRPRARRIRRHHHLCLQHSGRDADDLRRHLHFAADSRRGSIGGTPGADRDRALTRRADRFRVVRTPRRHAVPGRMVGSQSAPPPREASRSPRAQASGP